MYYRMIGAALIALAIALMLGPGLIRYLKKLHFGQTIYELGPSHQQKQGTPVMGGLMIAAGILAAVQFFANELNALAVGDEAAMTRGVAVRKARLFFVIAASLLASSCVAAAGIIGFAGLVVPHIVRLLAGSDHRRILPAVFLSGGCFLQLCDLTAVALSGAKETPVGVVCSCAGGILFLVLLAKRRRQA